jgi:plasmid stability protein
MSSMATLYIRNVPAELYDRLKRRADRAGRSVNAEILEVLARDDAGHRQSDEFERLLAEMKAKYPPIESNAVELIREDRDRGHKPEFGY